MGGGGPVLRDQEVIQSPGQLPATLLATPNLENVKDKREKKRERNGIYWRGPKRGRIWGTHTFCGPLTPPHPSASGGVGVSCPGQQWPWGGGGSAFFCFL